VIFYMNEGLQKTPKQRSKNVITPMEIFLNQYDKANKSRDEYKFNANNYDRLNCIVLSNNFLNQ